MSFSPLPSQESKQGTELEDANLKRICALYLEQVRLPAIPGRPFLLCPVGLVGAGKSTVLKPLAEYFSLVRVSTDEIRKVLKDQGYNFLRTSEIAYFLVRKFLGEGYGVAVDADCSPPEVSEAIRTEAAKAGLPVVWIHIDPPESFILEKLRNFKHTWLFADADEAVANYFRRKPLHQTLDFPFVYRFDTSRLDLPQQLEEAKREIEAFLSHPVMSS